jgi:hypothetical protein
MKQGLLPVVRLSGTVPVVTTGKNNGQPVSSTNYQPVWQIVKWVPRPVELQPGYDQKNPAPAQQPAAQQPPAAAPAPAPPVPQQQLALASVEDDF